MLEPGAANSSARATSAGSQAVAALCPKCALCCNGVLFVDVRLQATDDAERLASMGVPVRSRGTAKRFAQPCACLDGKECRIYADRPSRCRSFECGLLKKVQAGQITERVALTCIRRARDCSEKVRRILRGLGDTNETVPLSRRYQRMMRQPIDLSADERIAELRGELIMTVADLVGLLEKHFLQ